MSDGTKSPTSTEFSVLVLITFLLKIDVLGLVMLDQGKLRVTNGNIQLMLKCKIRKDWAILAMRQTLRQTKTK